jgi:peptidoglycan/xylan/chitin deacetylase (PgdA/CDA1 family)
MRGKSVVKSALRRLGSVAPPDARSRVVVLCYHSVHPALQFRSATPSQFADHLAWLRDHCSCVPFGDVPSAREGRRNGRPIVCITFDDGYADNHRYVLPLLLEHQLSATFFVTAGFIDRDRAALERFGTLRKMKPELVAPLEWRQVAEIREAGMEIGAHTYTHPNLATLAASDLRFELEHSKQVIEERLGCPVTTLAYPFGRPRIHVTAAVERAARRAGYDLAASIGERGVRPNDPPLRIPRIFVANDTVETLQEKVNGVWDLIGSVRERMPLAVARAVSRADFEV